MGRDCAQNARSNHAGRGRPEDDLRANASAEIDQSPPIPVEGIPLAETAHGLRRSRTAASMFWPSLTMDGQQGRVLAQRRADKRGLGITAHEPTGGR